MYLLYKRQVHLLTMMPTMNPLKSLFLVFAFIALPLSTANAKTFIMWAEGDGETLKEAKASAVTALSQQIISRVESKFKSEVSVVNDNVNRDVTSSKQIKSDLILKGVKYVDEVKSGNNIKITAGLDREAVKSTVEYMQKQLEVDFSILSQEKKLEALRVSDQLTALLSILPASVLSDFENIKSWNKNKRNQLMKDIYMGQVIFISNTPEYSITVDEKPAESGDYFQAGNYSFSAKAPGYRSMNGQFAVSAGEVIKVNLNFIKAIANKKIRLQLPAKYSYVKDDIVDVLSDLGISLESAAKNQLIVKIKDSSTDVDGYTLHKIKIKITAYQNKNRVKGITLRKKLIVEKDDAEKLKNETTKIVRKGVVSLLSRLDLQSFFE